MSWPIISSRPFLSLIACALTSSLAMADVRVVATDGSGAYLTIQNAVDAAVDGDVILVRPGTYPGFDIVDKSLVVTTEIGSRATVTGSVRVRNVAAHRTVSLSSLDVQGTSTGLIPIAYGLRLDNNQGAVRAQDCTFRAQTTALASGLLDPSGREGAFLTLCADVIFTRCEFYGGRGSAGYDCCAPGTDGGHGIESDTSMLALYDCHIEGFEGGYSGWGGQAGAGLFQAGPVLFASGCTLVGGKGGFGDDFIFGPGGNGGNALHTLAGTSSILVDVQLLPGAAGDSFLGSPGAQPGVPIGGPGAVSTHPGPTRHFTTTNIAWSGDQLGILIEGEPGDRVRVVASQGTDFTYRANVNAVWSVRLPAAIEAQAIGSTSSVLVTLPANGRQLIGIDVPSMGSTQGAPWYVQGLVMSASGTMHLTSPASVTRLQCAYSTDCNGTGVPDGCDITSGVSSDCNLNGIPDECDFGSGGAVDCNSNGVPDLCDISSGNSSDCNFDEIPDECQIDCNANGVPDDCDVLFGTSSDCDGNLIPDECSIDCNSNGVPDLCDISAGTSLDVNGNGVPDECQSPTDVYFVDATSVPWGDGSVGNPFDSVGQAVAYAISGNTIFVRDGVYTGPKNRDMSFGGEDLVLKSVNGPANCIIDLEEAGRAFFFNGGETAAARIEGLTIRNGHTANTTTMIHNTLVAGGAAIVAHKATPTIVGCVFEDNSGTNSVLADGGAILFTGPIQGDPLSAQFPPGQVLASTFQGNFAFRGGAIASRHNAGTLLIEDCEFSGNTGSQGSAVYSALLGGTTVLRGVDVRENHASYGGAIFQAFGSMVLTQSIVAENTGLFGGGIHVSGGVLFHMSHTILAANEAQTSQGGGLALLGNAAMQVRIDNCLVFANEAASIGGGLVLRDAQDMRITNCSFFLNQGSEGGALYIAGTGTHLVRNCLLWENHASFSGEQVEITSAITDIDYCNLQNGAGGISTSFGGTLVYGTHNSSVYPGFIDPDGPDDDITTWEDNDVRLGPTSDARDAGDNTAVGMDLLDIDGDGNTTELVPLDLAGVARFVDSNEPDTGNGTAPIVDLGCYESQ